MPDAPTGPVPTDTDRLAHEPATRCLDCGAVLPGRFCADCGQRSEPARLPLHRMARDSFAEVFGLDGRFWRSAGRLLFSPGFLTRSYIRGQRMRYVRPLRLYLTATLTFFFLLSVFDPAGRIGRQVGNDAADTLTTAAAALARVDSALAAVGRGPSGAEIAAEFASDVRRDVSDWSDTSGAGDAGAFDAEALQATLDSARVADGGGTADAAERQRLRVERAILSTLPADSLVRPSQAERAALVVFPDTLDIVGIPTWMGEGSALRDLKQATTRAERVEAIAALSRAAIARLPTVMFVLLPLFALLLKLLYVRRDWLYTEHLVFALHTHAFTFFVFALLVGLIVGSDGAGWAGITTLSVSTVAIPLYFVIAQKRVYEQSWVKTLAKSVVLGVMYAMVLALGLTGAIVLAAARG